MDFRKFGRFVLLIGVLIVAYGLVQIVTNQPIKSKRSDDRGGLAEALNEMGTAITSIAENSNRERARKTAVKIIFAGGVVAVLGVGIRASARS